MYSDSILTRKSDGLRFRVTGLAHWSMIEDITGEQFIVKWLGSNEYVSTDGIVFELREGDEHVLNQKRVDESMKAAEENGHDFSSETDETIAIDMATYDPTFEGLPFEVLVPFISDWRRRW